ncbi:MAG: hypothetical protein AB1Z57_06610 [Acidimicrobiia bacterium]
MDLGDIQWVAIGAGLFALLFGYRLVWVAVALAGFGGALQLMPLVDLTAEWNDTTRYVVAALVGIVLALVARTLTKATMSLIGFVLAATFVAPALRDLEIVTDLGQTGGLVVSLVAGALGAVVAAVAFKGAIVGLTSAWGATAVLSAGLGRVTEGWDPIVYLGVFAVLIIGGVLFQYRSG